MQPHDVALQVFDIETGMADVKLNLNPEGWVVGVTKEKDWLVRAWRWRSGLFCRPFHKHMMYISCNIIRDDDPDCTGFHAIQLRAKRMLPYSVASPGVFITPDLA